MTIPPLVVETIVADGARYRISWFDPPFRPPPAETTQALGICFTHDSQIVLVTWNDTDWTLPGGTIEPGENLEQTLAREVFEEACARVGPAPTSAASASNTSTTTALRISRPASGPGWTWSRSRPPTR